MTPMIDVIFLLLVFFLATSSFQVIEKLLPGSVSEARPTSGQDESLTPQDVNQLLEQVIVKIQERDGIFIPVLNGNELASVEDLRDRFLAIAQVQTGLPVIIDPQPSIPASYVVRAYDLARTAGFSQVYLATRSRLLQ